MPLIWVTDPVLRRIAEIAARQKAEFCDVIEGLLEPDGAAGQDLRPGPGEDSRHAG